MAKAKKAPTICVTTGTTMHGTWNYKTVVIYEVDTLLDGTPVWKKGEVVAEVTTHAKALRLAQEEAKARGIPFLAGIRHNQRLPAEAAEQVAAPAAAAAGVGAGSHGGCRPGAGRKPVVRFCNVCGAPCIGAIEARAHCAGGPRS